MGNVHAWRDDDWIHLATCHERRFVNGEKLCIPDTLDSFGQSASPSCELRENRTQDIAANRSTSHPGVTSVEKWKHHLACDMADIMSRPTKSKLTALRKLGDLLSRVSRANDDNGLSHKRYSCSG
jgi:hypothetical protein